MMPMKELHEGMIFQRPHYQTIYRIEDIDRKERMVKLQIYSMKGDIIGKPFWKKNSDSCFSESMLWPETRRRL
jgi:hypothetical protein